MESENKSPDIITPSASRDTIARWSYDAKTSIDEILSGELPNSMNEYLTENPNFINWIKDAMYAYAQQQTTSLESTNKSLTEENESNKRGFESAQRLLELSNERNQELSQLCERMKEELQDVVIVYSARMEVEEMPEAVDAFHDTIHDINKLLKEYNNIKNK